MDEEPVIGPGADLARADLSHRDLRRQNLRGASLFQADLSWSDLSKADLRGASLRLADLSHADLRDADLRGADLRDTDLRSACLQEANLAGASLTNATLIHADLYKANCAGVDLYLANLSGSYLGFAYFRRANLRFSDLSHANVTKTDFREAVICDADLTGIYYEEGPPDFREITYNLHTLCPDWLVFPDPVYWEPIIVRSGEPRQASQPEPTKDAQLPLAQQGRPLDATVTPLASLAGTTDPEKIVDSLWKNRLDWMRTVRTRIGIVAQAALNSVRDMSIALNGEIMRVGFAFGNNQFSHDLIAKQETAVQVEAILAEILGRPVKLECVMGDRVARSE